MACGCEIQKSSNVYLCEKCMKHLPIMTEKQITHFSPFIYEEPIRSMILRLKYSSNSFIAKALAPYLAAVYIKHIQSLFNEAPIIIPVPLHRSRQRERGYNQSEILANELTGYLKLPVNCNILIRNRKTVIQKHMDIEARAKNMHNAFSIIPENLSKVQNQNILLLDDVYTTGATTIECANVLLKHGARNVVILTVASVF